MFTSIKAWLSKIFVWQRKSEPLPIPAEPQIEIVDPQPAEPQPPEPERPIIPRPNRKLKRDVEEAVSEILDLFQEAEQTPIEGGTKYNYINAHQDLWGCDFHFIDDIADRMDGGDKYYKIDAPQVQLKETWPIDKAFLFKRKNRNWYETIRVATIPYEEIRGKVWITPERTAILSAGHLSKKKTWWAENVICGFINDKWYDIGTTVMGVRDASATKNPVKIKRTPTDPEEVHENIVWGFAAAIREKTNWHIAFGISEDGPRLLLPTNPKGCLALFRDREKSGSGRRTAIKHWVETHYRDQETSTADMIYVRDHLRGATQFEWRGLQCELLVSEYDLQKNEWFKARASEWRTQRKHNHIRLRKKDRRVA